MIHVFTTGLPKLSINRNKSQLLQNREMSLHTQIIETRTGTFALCDTNSLLDLAEKFESRYSIVTQGSNTLTEYSSEPIHCTTQSK